MGFVLGLNAKTFINQDYADLVKTYYDGGAAPSAAALAAAIASPDWRLRGNVTDVTISNSLATADVTTRGGNGFRQVLGTLKEAEISFDIIWDSSEPLFAAVFQAFEKNQLLDMAFSDGIITGAKDDGGDPTNASPTALTAQSGSIYYRAQFSITEFSIDQSLEEAIRASVTLQSGFSSGVPGFHVVA